MRGLVVEERAERLRVPPKATVPPPTNPPPVLIVIWFEERPRTPFERVRPVPVKEEKRLEPNWKAGKETPPWKVEVDWVPVATKYVPIKGLVEVTVPGMMRVPPRETAEPFRVIEEFWRLAFVMTPELVRFEKEMPPVKESEVP